jgi:hypothetical protein
LANLDSDGQLGPDALAMLFTASRAALLLETLEDGAPELPLTVAAVAAELGRREPNAREMFRAASGSYLAFRSSATAPPRATVAALARHVTGLAAYRHAGHLASST